MRSLVLALVLAGFSCACGPSYQAVNECDARFEHCYALDLTAGAPSAGRRSCWRDWLRGYTYGQSRDRVEYAATRLSQLSGESTPGREDATIGGNGADGGSPAATAISKSAFGPPPNVVEQAAPTLPAHERPVASLPRAPGSDCADACAARWRECREPCMKPCTDCDKKYRACASACFRYEERSSRPAPSASR